MVKKFVFRSRQSIKKSEINEALKKVDAELGQTLFLVLLQMTEHIS